MQAGLEHSEPGDVKPWQLSDPPTNLQEKTWKVQASRQTSAPSHGVPWMAAHDLCHYSVKTAPFKGEIFRSKLHLRLASRRCNFTSELRLCNLVCFISFFCVFVCTIAAAASIRLLVASPTTVPALPPPPLCPNPVPPSPTPPFPSRLTPTPPPPPRPPTHPTGWVPPRTP